jgi:ribonuclease P protein component
VDAPRQSVRGDRRGGEGFPRRRRLRRRADFLAIQADGRRFNGPNYLLLARRRPILGDIRLGITVSRKVGNAVERNRVKRWVRESYRRLSASLPAGIDLVVIARPGAARSDYRSTSAELSSLLRRLGPS